MVLSVLGILLIALGLTALVLQRFYSCVPAKELKRLAAKGDHLAEALYKPVAFGRSLRLLLWAVFCVSLAGGFFLIILTLIPVAAFVIVGLSVAAVVWLQPLRLTVRSAQFAVKAAPALNWLMQYLHGPFDAAAGLLNSARNHTAHSGLYEKEDLLQLLEQQKDQPDNRISDADLDLLSRAARFDDAQAADIALPMSRTRPVNASDHIGPLLLAELHETGQNSFLVYQDTPDHIVGTLLLRDAILAKEGGQVANLMHPRISFVHEDFSLRQVLKAFGHTGQFMVVVINTFEEPVGVITIGCLLEELVGQREVDDFDRYEDRAAVADWRLKQLQPIPVEVTDEEQPSNDPTEVVE